MSTAAATHSNMTVRGSRSVIRRFTFRRMLVGACIFGFFATVESFAQSFSIVAAYPNAVERAKVIYGLAGNAALGLFYGDRHADIASPAGYMVYRVVPILALISAIWGLLFITKMLRGQEEAGRWELLLSGETTARRATAQTLFGAGSGVAIAFVIIFVLLTLAGHNSKFTLSVDGVVLYGLAVMAGAAMAVGIGAVASQLAATRRRAVLYGMLAIIILFALRSVGNVVDSLVWLKNLTPFGWIDKLHPFVNAQPIWLLPIALFVGLTVWLAIWLSGQRDMGESFIADSDSARPKFKLLNSQLGFDFRLTRTVMSAWLLASVALASLVAAIDKTVAKSLTGTGALTKTFGNLSGNPSARLELAYLSAASYLTVTLLMVMVTTGMAATREEEASGRLDNIVSGPVSRRQWLGSRVLLLVVGAAAVAFITNLVVWAIAAAQGINVGFVTLVFGGLNILGPIVFLLGAGVWLFGLRPRLTSVVMYVLIAWSFTIDIVASVLKTNKFVADTSLLHHISLVPAAQPSWLTFVVLAAAGGMMIVLGLGAFQRRDLEAE